MLPQRTSTGSSLEIQFSHISHEYKALTKQDEPCFHIAELIEEMDAAFPHVGWECSNDCSHLQETPAQEVVFKKKQHENCKYPPIFWSSCSFDRPISRYIYIIYMKILLDSPHRGRNNRRANDIWVEVPFDGILAQLVGRNQPFLMLIFTCQCPHLVGLSSNVRKNL